MAIPGAHIRAGRGSEPVGRRGPKTSPKCWYMYGPCWATSISKLMFPKKYAWYPPLKLTTITSLETQSTVQQTMTSIIGREWCEGECVVLQCITQALELLQQVTTNLQKCVSIKFIIQFRFKMLDIY